MELNRKAYNVIFVGRRSPDDQELMCDANNPNLEGVEIVAKSADGNKVELVLNTLECIAIHNTKRFNP